MSVRQYEERERETVGTGSARDGVVDRSARANEDLMRHLRDWELAGTWRAHASPAIKRI